MIQIPLKTDHHRPASETSFKWRFDGVPMIAQLGSFVIFQGRGSMFFGAGMHVIDFV